MSRKRDRTEYMKEYAGKNKSKLTAYHRRWRKANPDKIHLYNRRRGLRQYGLTLDGFEWIYLAQGGKCLVCGKEIGYDACVDHDHETGMIRGLLHRSCNLMIGNAHDDPAILRAGAIYLEDNS